MTVSTIKLKATNGGGSVALKGVANTAHDVELTMPSDIGTADQYLKLTSVSGKTGTLAWQSAAAGGAALANDANNRVTTADGSGGINGEANLTFDGNDLTLGDGNVIFASGHGLSFAANTDGGGTSTGSLLEDYEEGSWTPVLTFGNSSSGITINSGHIGGYYTKVGNLVHATGYMYLSSKGSQTGHAEVSLPYQPAPHSSPHTHGQWGMCSEDGGWNYNFTCICFRVRADASKAYFQPMTNGTAHEVYGDNDDFTNSTKFIFTVVYRAS